MAVDLAVVAIGDELLSGERSDTHTARLAQALQPQGYALRRAVIVGDNEADIAAVLTELAGKFPVVIATGGLGGTADDLTARAAARAFGRRLWLHDESLAHIRQRLSQLQRPLQPHHERQALLPQKAAPLGNPLGLAPGFHLAWNNSDFFFLPGVPEEMEAMLTASLLPRLKRLYPGEIFEERRLELFGLPESTAEHQLLAADLPAGVSLGYGVHFPTLTVKLRARGADATSLLDHAEIEAMRALGDAVFSRSGQSLAEVVAELLLRNGLSLALAESCTGGMIAQQLTDIPGSSAFLERCGVVYANRAKQSWLGVPEALLREQGAVSRECALAMAAGVRRAAGTDIGLSVTGIAGPGGGSADKPVGTVFLGLATAEGSRVKACRFAGDRQRVRQMSTATALDWLRQLALQRQMTLE